MTLTPLSPLSANNTDTELLSQAASDWDIPIQWLETNVKRDRKRKAWVFGSGSRCPQIRFDEPPIEEKTDKHTGKTTKKAIRYKTEYGCKPDVYIPNRPDGKSYAEYIGKRIEQGEISIDDVEILITEGYKKAIKGCSEGIFTIASTGIWNALVKDAEGNRILTPTLQGLYDDGIRKYSIGYDADCASNPDVHKASIELGNVLQSLGCTIRIITGLWEPEQGKGMDDFISKNGIEAFRGILENAYTLDEYITEHQDIITPNKGKKRRKKLGRLDKLKLIADIYKDRIAFNELTMQIEKNNKDYDATNAYLHILEDAQNHPNFEELNHGLGKVEAQDIMLEIAKANSYHPVTTYLQSCSSKAYTGSDDDLLLCLRNAFTDIFDEKKSELEYTFIIKSMLAAVARVYTPGVFLKTMLVLFGGQDYGKSSFIRELAGKDFYGDSYKGTDDTNDLMTLHSTWIHEIPELDKIFGKVNLATLKANISKCGDIFREPYARATFNHKRRGVMWGTTNKKDLLQDPTGSVRYLIVRVNRKINFHALKQYRDIIWGTIFELWKRNYSHELTEGEKLASKENNEQYSDIDPYYEDVLNLCKVNPIFGDKLRPFVTIKEIYTTLHPNHDWNDANKRRSWRYIAENLTKIGYESGRNRRNPTTGRQEKGWGLVTDNPLTVANGNTTVTETQQGFEGDCYRVTDDLPQRVQKTSNQEIESQHSENQLQVLENGNTVTSASNPDTSTVTVMLPIPTENGSTVTTGELSVSVGDKVRLTANCHGLFEGEVYEVVAVDGSDAVIEPCHTQGKKAGQSLGKKWVAETFYEVL